MPIHNIHDSGYKKLFSNRTFLRQLLETFVDEPWVKEVDFEAAETLDKSFVADHYKTTESDLIYKLKLHGRDLYIYLLLEFQSSVDRFMAVRVAYYILAFYMDYIANSRHRDAEADPTEPRNGQTQERLPPIFPLVVYNGSDRWTAPEALAELVEPEPALGAYGVHCRYFKIAENAFDRERLLTVRNLVSTLFLAETHYEIELLIEEFVHLFTHEPDRQAVSLLVNWFYQLVVHGRIREQDYDTLEQEIHSVQEVRTMLIDAVAKEKEQIREEGREEGETLATTRMIEQILQRKLGEIPTGMRERLVACTLAQLNTLVNPALDAATWDEFIVALPTPAE